MQAIELDAFIDSHHEIHVRLPPEVKQGKARVIVLYEDSQAPPEFGNLDDFLDTLQLNAEGRAPEDIQAQIQEERDSWGEKE